MSNVIKRTSSHYSAARGLDIVPRLIAFVVCFYLVIASPFAYATAYTGSVDFFGFNNFVRTANGAVADFWFKNKTTAAVFGARAKAVTNGALGVVARNRILRLTPQSLVVGFVVGEVISALIAKDWIVDQDAQRIYKNIGGWCVRTSSSNHPTTPSGYIYCADSPVAAANAYLSYYNTKVKQDAFVSSTGTYNNYTYYDNAFLQSTIDAGTTAVEVRARVSACNSSGCTLNGAFTQVFLDKVATSQIDATAADVAAVLPDVSDDQIESLLDTPDYATEPHAPTLAAAAAAGVASPASGGCAGSSGTFNGTVFCVSDAPAGVQDNLSGETGSASGTSTADRAGVGSGTGTANPVKTTTNTATTTNADGSTTTTETTTTTNADGTTTTQTKSTTTNPDGTTTTTTTGEKASDTPAFCVYAQTLCDWIGWTKQNPDAVAAAATAVVVAETSESDILPNFDISEQRVVFASSCPPGIPINFAMVGASIDTTFSYKPLCDFMSALKPFVIASAYITGAYIISGVGRGGGNNG